MKTYGSIFNAKAEGTICLVKQSYYAAGAGGRFCAAIHGNRRLFAIIAGFSKWMVEMDLVVNVRV